MTLIGPDAYVAAYNNDYGDLMIGHITPPGVVQGWDFVDGVPDGPPDITNSHNRGGISDKGDDVGRYPRSRPRPTASRHRLLRRRTARSSSRRSAPSAGTATIDVGIGAPSTGGDVGRWTS
jgi:hypothetical protein